MAEDLIDSSNVLSYNDIMNRINDVEMKYYQSIGIIQKTSLYLV
jgi:hypothetical protein